MAARVLHFGWDDCYRVQVLQRAGYIVSRASVLDALEFELGEREPVDAVIVSEGKPDRSEQAAKVIRRRSAVPIILFRSSPCALDDRNFDQVYPSFVPPQVWLARTAELIAQSRALQARSARLIAQSRAIREESRRLRERLRTERARNEAAPPQKP